MKNILLLIICFLPPTLANAQVPYQRIANAKLGNWLTYSGNYQSHRFSSLNQITPDNVAKLGVPAAHARVVRRAGDGGRRRFWRSERRQLFCAQCRDWQTALGFSNGRGRRSEPNQLFDRRQPTRGDCGGASAVCVWLVSVAQPAIVAGRVSGRLN